MNKKEQHHIIPKTFLRRFEIPNFKLPNHVWCLNFEDKYTQIPTAKGVNSPVFKIKNFYSLPGIKDKLYLENFFAEKVEPEYEKIINEISQEKEINELIRLRILEWFFYTNQRTDYFREQIRGIYENISEFMYRFDLNKNGLAFSKESFEEKICFESKIISKQIQLDAILNKEDYSKIFLDYYRNLVAKSWEILKSNSDNPFIANDNPGFSINTSEFYFKQPYQPTIHLNHIAFNYFVISPKYCLYMEPFKTGTPIEVNAFNMNIEFKEIPNELIDFINLGTFLTSKKYAISNRYDSICKWIKNKN